MESLSDQTKILILVVIIGVVIYFFTQSNSSSATPNEGTLTQNIKTNQETDADIQEVDVVDVVPEADADETVKQFSDKYLAKFKTRNSAEPGNYAFSSYSQGRRGGRGSDLDKFFENGHPLDQGNGMACDDVDEAYARYVPGKKKKLRDVDKFDADAMLPREQNKDWFDDPYQPTTIKNAHMINIHRPIGVNTIGSSMKNPSHDLRGDTYINPKVVVSPFLNSSIEPDTNIRSSTAFCG